MGGAALNGAVVGVTATKLSTLEGRVVTAYVVVGEAAMLVVDDVDVGVGAGGNTDVVVVGAIVASGGLVLGRRVDDDVRVKTSTTRRIGLDHITR